MRVIIFLIPALLISAFSTGQDKAKKHYYKAIDFYQTDNIKGAFKEIEKAIALDRSNLDFQMMKADIFIKIDGYEQAIQVLTGLLSKKFKSDTVNFNLGYCYFKEGVLWLIQGGDLEKSKKSFEKSLSYYDSAINANPQYYDVYIEKGRALHNLKRYSEAITVFNTAIALFPDEIALICERGKEKTFLEDFTGAMDDLSKSIESDKLDSFQRAEAYRFRGILFEKKGDLDRAINDLTKSLTFNPKQGLAFATRADLYKAKGLKDKACEDYKKAADLGLVSLYEINKDYCKE